MEEQTQQDFHQTPDDSFYTELVSKANELKSSTDWQFAAGEFDAIRQKWSEGPEIDVDHKKELYAELTEAMDAFAKARKENYDKVQERKKANFEKRDGILQKIRSIVENKRWSAYNEVYTLQRKFDEIRPLPVNADMQNEEFASLMNEFNEGKVEYLVRIREKEEENLMGKLAILDKMEQVIKGINQNTSDWTAIESEIEALSDQWKKVGRVVKEKSDEIWDKFKALRDQYFALKLEFNNEYRGELEKNLKTKTLLAEKAEALLKEEDLALASKEMNILNKRWKEVGPVSREASDAIWERFRTASDAFSQIRNENLDTIRDAEQRNLDLKEALITRAEAIVQASGAEEQREIIEKLFQEWNSIGPIPKRKTKKVWSRFKKAIDKIQDQRRNFFKQQRQDQKDNLAKKREIIDKIAAFSESEAIEEVLPQVKELQAEYQKVGFVPIKQKNKLWDEYRKACDLFYKNLRATGNSSREQHSSGSSAHSDGGSRSEFKQKQQELFRLKKECDKLNDTILQYADTKTYIKPNKKGQALIDEIQQKIDSAKEELAKKSEDLDRLRQELDSLS
jgi:hypothetical protein